MDFDFFFESFREKANVTFQDLADDDSNLCGGVPCPPSLASRAFNFTPNTDRLSGSLRVSGKLGPVSLHGGAFLTSLRQTNTGPLGLDKQDLMTWSGHAGFDTPLGEWADVSGFVKFSQRRNGLDANDLEVNSYIAPLLRRRSELEAQVELAARPLAGSLVATGYRFDRVDRNFRYPDPTADPTAPPAVLDPPLSLVENDSERHTVYLRGRARLLRRVQVSGELGWQYAPQRDFPRDATSTIYFDGRGSTTLPRPFPVTLSVYGSVRDGQGNGIVLTGEDTQARKDFDRLQWNYGATLAAIPGSRTTITLSFIENRDEQDFPYLRTDIPRTFGSSFSNLLPDPERPHYKSDVKSLSLGCAQKLTDSLDGRAFTNVHWVRAWFSDSSQTSTALEDANEIKSTILSLGGGLGWKALPGLRLDLGYRFDHYLDHRDQREPIRQNDERHTFTLAATVDIGLFTGTLRSSQASSD